MKKRLLVLFLSLVLAAGTIPVSATATDGSAFANLVVFCRFADETEFIENIYAETSVTDILCNTYSRSMYSAADYFETVSEGKLRLKTYYLTADGQSLVLSKPRGYYARQDTQNPDGYTSGQASLRISELMRDWGDAVSRAIAAGNLPKDAGGNPCALADLDRNGDGEIDLITVIYKYTTQNIDVAHGDPLWDYQTRSGAVSLSEDGREYRSDAFVQLTCQYVNANGDLVLYQGSDGLPILGTVGKICHETMHALGLKDLYHTAADPKVGYMSLMGKHTSPMGQYLSVKEREALGWLGADRIRTMRADGSYTLNEASGDGVVGWKRELANGKTLYLEYRRFDDKGNRYDRQKKDAVYMQTGAAVNGISALKNGLVCYLVDTDVRFPSNLSGTTQMDVVSIGQYNTNTDCAVGVGETLDSVWNGTDGWVSLTVTEMTDSTLRFTVRGLPETTVKGDFNGDGCATVADTLLLLRAVLDGQSLADGDLNEDGVLTLADVLASLRLSAD